jgi:hypothetical protein
LGHPYVERPLLWLSDCMLTGALTAPQYDSVPGDCDSDIDYCSDSECHDDIDYAYGLGEFGYVGEFA